MGARSSQSAPSRRPRPEHSTTRSQRNRSWRRDSNQPASGKPGAIQEARREELKPGVASAKAPAPRLHPNLAQVYRRKVAELADALAREDGAEVREQLRGLVEEVRLLPEEGVLRVDVRGALALVLALGNEVRDAKSPSLLAGALVLQIKMDAGTGFEPVTFRL